jgi:hypothetical protein
MRAFSAIGTRFVATHVALQKELASNDERGTTAD